MATIFFATPLSYAPLTSLLCGNAMGIPILGILSFKTIFLETELHPPLYTGG